MDSFEAFLRRIEELFTKVDELDEPARSDVLELLDGIDTLHRTALERLPEIVDEATLARLRAYPEVAWLLEAYRVGSEEEPSGPAPVLVQIKQKPPR